MSSTKLATGILLGAAAGAVLGILFAPDKGSETRKAISKKSTDLKNAFKGKMNDLVDDLASQFEDVKTGAEKLAESGKEKVASMRGEAKQSLS